MDKWRGTRLKATSDAQNAQRRGKRSSGVRRTRRGQYSDEQTPRGGLSMAGSCIPVFTRSLSFHGKGGRPNGGGNRDTGTGPAEAGPARPAIDVPDVTHKKAAHIKMARLLCACIYRISTPDRCCFQRQFQYRAVHQKMAIGNSNSMVSCLLLESLQGFAKSSLIQLSQCQAALVPLA